MAIPDERKVKRAVAASLGDKLAYCREILAFGTDLPNPAIVNQRRLKADTVTVAMGLYTKACLSYKGIICLCEAGLDRTAAPVNRSLFETLLNLTFLLRRRVVLCQFDSASGKKTRLDLFGKKLDTQFRTNLYCAFSALQFRKMVGQWPRTPGLRRTGRSADRKFSALPQPHVAALGGDWVNRLKKANTCAGLRIADYAASLGEHLYTLYRSVYAVDSQSVHQSDSLTYVEIDDAVTSISPRWYTSSDEVGVTLQMASLMFVGCMGELNKRLGFGQEAADHISKLDDALNGWSLSPSSR